MVDSTEIDRRIRDLPLDDAASVLRASGVNDPIEAIKAVMRVHGLTLGQAKQLIHLSDAFRDVRLAAEPLHEALSRLGDNEVN